MVENQRINMRAHLIMRDPEKPVVEISENLLPNASRMRADFSKARVTFYNRASGNTTFPIKGNVPWEQAWIPKLLEFYDEGGKIPALLDGEIIRQEGEYIFVATRILLGF